MRLSTALNVFRRASDKESLDSMIFFVTSVCNAKCGTCFYWQNLNQKGDLTFEEIEKMTEHMPPFRSLLLSGGEPTLRKDLVKVVGLFVKNNGIQTLSMPTNGLIPPLVTQATEGFLGLDSQLTVTVAVSIDGPGQTHDEIRGVPGNYEKAIQSLEKLIQLREKHPDRLGVNVTSVVCSRNLKEIPEFAEYLFKTYNLDMHNLVLIRGEPMIENLLLSDKKAIQEFQKFHYDLLWRYHERRTAQGRSSSSVPGRLWERGFNLESQDITYRNFSENAAWPFDCLAGQIVGVIDWNGDVRSCELRKPVANIRKYDYDFRKLWKGPEMAKEIESISKDKCFCTHGCFLQPSQAHDRTSSLIRGPLKALRYTLGRRFA
jgi:Fe-coproporphyrin III synthase